MEKEAEWKIIIKKNPFSIKVVNESGEEMDYMALQHLISNLDDHKLQKEEERFGKLHLRKEPLDEFTQKRLGIQDYVLIEDNTTKQDIRNLCEAYADSDDAWFIIDRYVVFGETNTKSYFQGYNAFLSAEEAEMLLEPLQNFVKRHKKDT